MSETRPMRHSMKSSRSISSATLHQSQVSTGSPMSCLYIHRFRPKLFISLSSTRRPVRARLTWLQQATGPVVTFRANGLRSDGHQHGAPYRGSAPAMTDLIAGHVEIYFGSAGTSIEHIKAGRLRALAVTTANRSELLPDIPTINETLPEYEASFWTGVGAPRGTPADITDKLNKEINIALTDPQIVARLAAMGSTTLPGSAADFRKLIIEETDKWARVIHAANIKPE